MTKRQKFEKNFLLKKRGIFETRIKRERADIEQKETAFIESEIPLEHEIGVADPFLTLRNDRTDRRVDELVSVGRMLLKVESKRSGFFLDDKTSGG